MEKEKVEVRLAEVENKEADLPETAPATPLLTAEAKELLGYATPARWRALSEALKSEKRPVRASNYIFQKFLEEGRRHKTSPKCAACGGGGPLGYNVAEDGTIRPYHYGQCSEGKKISHKEAAEWLSQKIKSAPKPPASLPLLKISGPLNLIAQVENPLRIEDLEKAVSDAADILRVQDEMKATGKEGARKVAAKASRGQQEIFAKKMAEKINSRRLG